MKVVILAGGLGSRLAEETELKPKPMVEIGGRPILWHILKHYSHYGFNEFFIAVGYKGELIKRYFLDYHNLSGNITLNLAGGNVETHSRKCEDWIVHLIDTGTETNTGGRVKRLEPWLKDSTFMTTYGDGVSNLNIQDLLRFHRAHGKIATVTAVRPPSRFGGLIFNGDLVAEFTEKPQIGEGWINGGFLVFEPAVFDYLSGDESSLEAEALEQLAIDKQLVAYRHAHNVLAHVADLNGFVRGLRLLLKDDGIVVIEVPYVKDLIDRCEFDTIYHEHLCYFSLTAMNRLFERHGLTIQDVERLAIHGGSLRVFVANGGKQSSAVQELLEEENAWGVGSLDFYLGFADRVEKLKNTLRNFIATLKQRKERLAAYGAAAKGSTLLNYFQIGPDELDFVVDRSTYKQGHYMPGVHLPICPPTRENPPPSKSGLECSFQPAAV